MNIPKIYREKQNLQQMLGRMEQWAGIREFVFENGTAEGVHAAEVYNATGLSFTVLKSRGLDIADLRFKGIPLTWVSQPGITFPTQGYFQGNDFLRGFYGGLLVTCGLSYTGVPNVDNGEALGLHGRYSQQRARVESVKADWMDDEYVLSITGKAAESKVFGPNLILSREIRTTMFSKSIEIRDEVLNWSDKSAPHGMLYHLNFGYPLIAPGAELVYKLKEYLTRPGGVRQPDQCDFKKIVGPMKEHEGEKQDFAYIIPERTPDGLAVCGVVNYDLGLAVKIEYTFDALPRLGNWLHFGGYGDYVVAYEPMNGGVDGRADDRKRGWLEILEPGQSKKYFIRFTVLDSNEDISEFVETNR